MKTLGYTFTIQDPISGEYADMTDRVIPGSARVNRAGVTFAVYMDVAEMGKYIADYRVYKIIVTRFGVQTYYRLTVPKVQTDKIVFVGSPLTVVLDDLEFNYFFSTRNLDRWLVASEYDTAGVSTGKYITSEIAVGDRGYAGLIGGQAYGNGVDGFGWYFETDRLHAAGAASISVEFDHNLPTAFSLQILRLSRGQPWGYLGTVYTATPAAGGAANCVATAFFAGSPSDIVLVWIVNTSGVTYTAPAGSTGVYYISIRAIRIMGFNNSSINTTTSGALATGPSQLVTVASTSGMVAGEDVYFDSLGSASGMLNSEKTLIDSIVNATQFRAYIRKAHLSGINVRQMRVVERGVTDRIFALLATNPGWIANSQALTQNTGRDLDESEWYKAKISDVLADLAKDYGWEYGVTQDGYLYLRPDTTAPRLWYVDALAVDVNRPIEGASDSLINSVQVEYKDVSGKQQLIAAATDTASIAAAGLTRSRTITIDTTNTTTAQAAQALALADGIERPIESSLKASYIMNETGRITAPDLAEPGDIITIRNASAIWGDPSIANIPISDIELNPESGELTITPSAPIQTLDRWLARIKK